MRSERRTARLIGLVLLASTTLNPGSPVLAGSLVERTMAFVNKRPVLLSDVELARALLRLDPAEALERSIDEELMFEEASRLTTDPPSADALQAAVETLREKAGRAFSEAALRRKAHVQLTISSYIDLRLRPLVRVEDSEVRGAFNDLVVSKPEPPAFSAVGPALRTSLEARALDEKIEEWVAGLRLRANIRRPATPQVPPAEPG